MRISDAASAASKASSGPNSARRRLRLELLAHRAGRAATYAGGRGLRCRLSRQRYASTEAHLGIALFEDVLAAITGIRNDGVKLDGVIHHFMGHAPELILQLVQASGVERPIVWTHDFFTICPSYALLSNDRFFCGAPEIEFGGMSGMLLSHRAERPSKPHARVLRGDAASHSGALAGGARFLAGP